MYCIEKGLSHPMVDKPFSVGSPRFELGMTEPKPVVLPLHHDPIISVSCSFTCSYYSAMQSYNFFLISANLFRRKKEILLFALLNKHVFAIEQISLCKHLVELCKFVFVYTDATALYKGFHLAL